MKKNSYLFVIQLISLMMVFTYNIVLARNLGPAEYGDFSTAFSFVSIAYVICLLGADITAFKFIAIAYDKKKYWRSQSIYKICSCNYCGYIVFILFNML
jgi:O-antigen/teichoic acid export membrane protein